MNMVVQPVVAEMLPGGQGYRVTFQDPWPDFPTADAVADTAAVNRWIEAEIRRNPAQYRGFEKSHTPGNNTSVSRVKASQRA